MNQNSTFLDSFTMVSTRGILGVAADALGGVGGLAGMKRAGMLATVEKALLYEDAWRALEDPVRETLANALNLDGRRGEPAVQPTYIPALLGRIQDVNALVCTLHYLAQVMSATDIEDPSAVVIERSVYPVLKQFVESEEFLEDPTILEKVDMPDGVVALNTASI